MNKSIYKPYKELILSCKTNINSIIQKDITKTDYNSIKDMLEEKQQIFMKNNDIKTRKILPPEASNKKKYKK